MDSKLFSKLNIEYSFQKAAVAYYKCRKIFGFQLAIGLKWMYTIEQDVLYPILEYETLVWWTATKTKQYTEISQFSIPVVFRISPLEALNTLLHLYPMDCYIIVIAASSIVRLNASTCDHARIIDLLPQSPTNHLSTQMPIATLTKT